jgi:DNA-binding MurR/RpiR family transcriptional regulator
MQPILDRLAEAMPEMTPQLRKAARYVVENPNDVGVGTVREVAEAADVKPNTLVRMARALGFEGYEDFRQPFRETLRNGQDAFPDRARWLQSLARGGDHGRLFSQMAGTAMENIQRSFEATSASDVKAAADRIVAARTTYVLGLGVSYALAHNFAYLTRMAVGNVVSIPREGNSPIDDIARGDSHDVLLAMTFRPYRAEVVQAVRSAVSQGLDVIALTDSLASPIVADAEHAFVLETETPQFFTSTVAAAALLETITAFVVADADPEVIANIQRFHERRHQLGVYWNEDT